jgi:hypothetical protein
MVYAVLQQKKYPPPKNVDRDEYGPMRITREGGTWTESLPDRKPGTPPVSVSQNRAECAY